jgi:hypothetical protein
MSEPPSDDPANGPNFFVLIIILVVLAFGCAWLLGRLRNAGDALTCLAARRHNCERFEQ